MSHSNCIHRLPIAQVLSAVLLAVAGNVSLFADEAVDNTYDSYLSADHVDGTPLELAAFQQPGTRRPGGAPRLPSRRAEGGQNVAAPSTSGLEDYLASAPRMFGHYYGASGQLLVRSLDGNGQLKTMVTDLPIGGGGSPLQITDNNTPVPQSRFFFNYNHYENALRTTSGNQQLFLGVDQYTMGIEQSFLDGISSWQLQLPMTGGFGVAGDPGVSAGQFGNLGFISKTAIWRSDYAILSGGFGLELPTGSSVQGRGQSVGYRLRNSATTVLPFIGVMALPTDDTFFQAFVTASVPASGNEFLVFPPGGGPPQSAGYLNSQTRLHLDLAGGLWLYQNPGGGGVTGLAFIGEIHYVAATQHGDFINFNAPPASFQLGNLANQQTTTNFTVGFHTVWNDRFQFRVGGAFPLAERPNRGFDGEVFAQVNFIP